MKPVTTGCWENVDVSRMRRYRRAFEDEEGISLVELMMAAFIIAVALVALAGVTASSITSLRVSRSRQMAVDASSAALEQARALDYEQVALPVGATSDTTFGGENIVFSHQGSVSHESTAGVGNEITVTTYVTWVVQDGLPQAARRVTTVATWTDGGQTRTLSESTIVAQAERGLPVPNFGVQPPAASKTTAPGSSSTDTCPSETRIDHTLTNVGASDSYEVRVKGNGETVSLSGSKFTSANTKWSVTVYFTPAVGSGSPPADVTASGTYEMRDFSPSGDSFVEALDGTNNPVRLSTGESAFLTFCYKPLEGAKNATFTVTARSRFDNAITEEFTHNLFVANTALSLYLHDPDNTRDHQRKNNPSIFTMSTNATSINGTYNYDTNLDPDNMPGVWLKDGDTLSSVTWDYQTPNELKVHQASLLLHGALDGLTAGQRAVFSVVLQHVNKNGNSVLATLGPTDRLAIAPDADRTFKAGTLEWTFPATTIPAQDRLRLTILCHGDADDDCHVMYDSASFLSRLAVSG